MFQCYMQPAQEKFSCPQISTAPLPSLVPAEHAWAAPAPPGRGAPSLPRALTPPQQIWEPARLWASPVHKGPDCCRCSAPCHSSSSVWGALQEASSWHNTGLELTLVNGNNANELKSPRLLEPSQSLAHRAEEPAWTDTCWRRLGQIRAVG